MSPRSVLRAVRQAEAGFTLVELTVALVAGLIVALGIVGLSREATRTFNEESRNSAAEAALRTAVDRLRADLSRAGYMSTGNILSDTQIAHAPGKSNVASVTNNGFNKGLKALTALQLIDGGSVATSTLALSGIQNPAVNPDAVLIGGNMTCAEQFVVQQILPPTGVCQQILLSVDSPAIYRIATAGLADPSAPIALNNAFAPVVGNGLTAQFIVRLLDDTGHTQYLATCGARADVAGITGGQPYVWIDSVSTPILTAADTQGVGGISGPAYGKAWINPVQVVRWEITSTALEAVNQKQLSGGLGNVLQANNVDPNKYDLVRSYVDASANVIAASTEVVAEYAVDLDFAFTVDNTVVGATAPSIVSYAFEDTQNNQWGADISALNPPPSSPPALIGPQRIRSVRARLVTRTALPDRSVNVAVPNQFGNEEYMYRYCITTPCNTSDGTPRWARARTVTTEVALTNNSGSYY